MRHVVRLNVFLVALLILPHLALAADVGMGIMTGSERAPTINSARIYRSLPGGRGSI
jgi:hypothetical protein